MIKDSIIHALADTELEDANKKHPPFQTAHEAYGVILEEMQEVEEALERAKEQFAEVWDCVRHDMSIKHDLGFLAENMADVVKEAIQVMAMCKKGLKLNG